jgi:CDP-diacylglycerol---serine O-phosphatidyltransferase
MKKITQHLPNFLTCINVLSGCLAIPYALKNDWQMVAIFVIIALIVDFFDGFLARLLKVNSKIGGELDSLADVITFGVLPGMVMFQVLTNQLVEDKYWAYSAFLIPVFSAIRLAKFNVDETQTYHFRGLPTPANASFFISFPFLLEKIAVNPVVIIGFIVLFSYFLVSELKLIALKFKSKEIKDNLDKVVVLCLSIVCFILLGKIAFVAIIPLYIITGVIINSKKMETK